MIKFFRKKNKIIQIIKKPWLIALFSLLVVFGVASSGFGIFGENGENQDLPTIIAKEVQTAILDLDSGTKNLIETVGTLKAQNQVDVTATVPGTVRSLFFDIGDEVSVNKILGFLYDSANLTNLNNAKTYLINSQLFDYYDR